ETYPDSSYDLDVTFVELLGHELIVHTSINNQKVLAKVNSRENIVSHQPARLAIDLNRLFFFDKETTNQIK
ncbi:MAG: sugar ABC transporter ATP-binding protein, partial [Bacilli bacterium]